MKALFKKYKKKIFIVTFLGIVNVFMLLIFNTFLLSPDEYNYSHIAWTNIKIDSYSKIVDSLKSMYINWTGRIPVMALTQIFLWKGRWIYLVLNTIIFSCFPIIISKATNKKISIFSISFVIFCLIFTNKAFAEKFLWLSGSINYLWTVSLMLVMIKFYYDIIIDGKKLNLAKGFIYIFISFLCGWSHENVVFYLGSFIIVLCIYKIKDFIKYDFKTKIFIILNIISFGIGAILLLFCPGNFSRLNSGESVSFFHNFKVIIRNFYDISGLLFLYFISIGLLLMSESIIKDKSKFFKNEIIIFLIPLGISLIPMLKISEFPSRSMLVYETIIMMVTLYNFSFIIEKGNYIKIFDMIAIILVIFVVAKLSNDLYNSQVYLKPYKNIIEQQIEIAKEKGYNEVYLTRLDNEDIKTYNDVFINYSPTSSKDGVINMYMSIYYNFDSIIALKDDEYLVSINLKEQVAGAQNFKLINTENNSIIYEKKDDSICDKIYFIIKKDEFLKNKIKFDNNDIENQIDKIRIVTNIDVNKGDFEYRDFKEIEYNEIIVK